MGFSCVCVLFPVVDSFSQEFCFPKQVIYQQHHLKQISVCHTTMVDSYSLSKKKKIIIQLFGPQIRSLCFVFCFVKL